LKGNSMKALFLSFAFLASLSAFGASAPSEETFSQVGKQADQLGYRGYDVFLCTDATGKVVVGGLAHWGAPLQIYIVDGAGAVTPTSHVSNTEDGKVNNYVANGKPVVLTRGEFSGVERPGLGQVLKYENSFLQVGSAEMAQVVNCYLQASGLESVR
jgi:hypothetical protein